MMRTIFTIIITIIIGGLPSKDKVTIKNTQNCSAELTVEKNRSFKSANENGVEFKLTLTNTSDASASYELITSKLLSSCSNRASKNNLSKSSMKNSDLNVFIKQNNSKALSNDQNNVITIESGQSKEFIVNALVPEGTSYNTWGCIKVEANSTNCKSAVAEIILSVYIPDPSEG